jgi:DNA replication and repair protein RecF
MILREINFQGFRNLADLKLNFAEDFNFFIGNNAAGKTNLLEAIFYVCVASSFRAREERSLIRFNNDFLRVDAATDGKKASIYLDKDKKRLTLQGNEVHKLSDYIGWLGVTLLSIEDIWILRGSPARRRSFLDWTIAKFTPSFVVDSTEYRKIVRQRNKALQQANENGDVDLLDVFDEQLINYGNAIYKKREENLPELKKHISEIGSELGLKKLDFEYKATCPDMEITRNILEGMRNKEIAFGQTLVGPHRDDLQFSIEGHSTKYYASEGEERAAAISLKLAEAEILHEKKGDRPILLIDEVGPELDYAKKETLINLFEGQVFYASTQMPQLTKLKNQIKNNVFKIERGCIEISAKN